jgi:hypothetical protein
MMDWHVLRFLVIFYVGMVCLSFVSRLMFMVA